MDAVQQIQKLGWEWRPDGLGQGLGPGVLLTVAAGGRMHRTFVPLARVWVLFDQELQKVGCPSSASVGAPFSVGGFFSFVAKAAKGVARAVSAPARAIKKAAKKVAHIAKKAAVATLSVAMYPAKLATKALGKIPVLGAIVGAAGALANLPLNATSQLVQGKRIDRIAVEQFQTALGSVKTLGPYIQTVISFVPGIGTGISAGIGGALALASGKSISEAMIEAAKGAIPGGPAAQAAFAVAEGVMRGKSIDQIAINALPIAPAAKEALIRGISAAKDLANGKRVDQIIIDQATRALPPALQKAVQIGTALGHAKNLQQGIAAAATGAVQLTNAHSAGVEAAKQFARGVRSPAVVAAMQKGLASKQALAKVVQHAAGGNFQAGHVVRAMATINRARAATPAPTRRFGITTPSSGFARIAQRVAPAPKLSGFDQIRAAALRAHRPAPNPRTFIRPGFFQHPTFA